MDEKPRRRWYSFSLLSLFALVTICAIVSYWFYSLPHYPLSGNISAAEAHEVCNALYRDHPEVNGQKILLVESHESGKATVTTSFPGEQLNQIEPGKWKEHVAFDFKATWQLRRTEWTGLDHAEWHVDSVQLSAWD